MELLLFKYHNPVEVKVFYEALCPSVGWLVGLSVGMSGCHNFLLRGGKLHFHAPLGALVTFSIMILFDSLRLASCCSACNNEKKNEKRETF